MIGHQIHLCTLLHIQHQETLTHKHMEHTSLPRAKTLKMQPSHTHTDWNGLRCFNWFLRASCDALPVP